MSYCFLDQKELEARILHLQEYRSHGLREFRRKFTRSKELYHEVKNFKQTFCHRQTFISPIGGTSI